MNPIQNQESASKKETSLAITGNASNPDPRPDDIVPSNENQLLGSGAEKYLREVASIEDVPDAQDQQDMDNVIEVNKSRKAVD